MNNNTIFVVKIGKVISTEDKLDGGRIRVRLHSDTRYKDDADELYCLPLLPKIFQSVPQPGEAVIVFCSEAGNDDSNRFYIGPIISQPQNFSYDSYSNGTGVANTGSATCLFKVHGSHETEPQEGISTVAKAETNGAFPPMYAQAVIGRESEDFYMRNGEAITRCGIRIKDQSGKLKGNVLLNRATPAINFLKYSAEGLPGGINSIGGTCAGKIALFTNDKAPKFYQDNGSSVEPEFMSKEQIQELFNSLHPLPYGDKLINFLKLFLQSYFTHTHAWAQLPLTMAPGSVHSELLSYKLEDMITNDIWIS